MSFPSIKWAFAQELPGMEKLVLLALANRADDRGDCWPSMSTIAKDAGVCRATVIRMVGKIERKGLVSLVRRTTSHGKSSHIYTLSKAMKKNQTPCSSQSHLDVAHSNIEPTPISTLPY